ncbi:hypothetical protein GCM10009851_00240 [Herbiconiux moechotypicola]|uniref:Uncharacterized protein n=1 Tax=Herbiconiux moechotypicola TaxID=637393 RepID=A0ABP5Q053_9MICO
MNTEANCSSAEVALSDVVPEVVPVCAELPGTVGWMPNSGMIVEHPERETAVATTATAPRVRRARRLLGMSAHFRFVTAEGPTERWDSRNLAARIRPETRLGQDPINS